MSQFSELVEWFSEPRQNQTDTRRWGVEIESPEVGRVAYMFEDEGWRTCVDESVTSPDCDCDCDSCEHRCDCDNCEIRNGYQEPDHCDHCRTNETASRVKYRQQFTDAERDALAELHRYNSEDMENGGHIHIEARDLTIQQVGLIMKGYLKIEGILGVQFTGREFCHYARDFSEWDETDRLGERYCAVNATNLVRWGRYSSRFTAWADDPDRPALNTNPKGAPSDTWKTTLEFRQFASTARAEIIEARASVCRALVDYFADGGAWYWLARCQTAKEVFELLEPRNH